MKCMNANENLKRKDQGFTLVEIMVSMSIFVAVLGMILSFYTQSYATLFKTEAALNANASTRTFLAHLLNHGRSADSFAVYDHAKANLTESDRVDTHDAGDFIAFAETELTATGTEYTNIIGYNVVPRAGDSYFDIEIFDYSVPSGDQAKPFDEIVSQAFKVSQKRTVFTFVKRIGDNGMFVNVDGGNVFTFYGIRVRFPEQAQPSKVMHVTASVRG